MRSHKHRFLLFITSRRIYFSEAKPKLADDTVSSKGCDILGRDTNTPPYITSQRPLYSDCSNAPPVQSEERHKRTGGAQRGYRKIVLSSIIARSAGSSHCRTNPQ